MDVHRIKSILLKFPETKGNLIAILHEIQNEYHYLPEEELRYVAKKTDVPLTQIYSIVNFYNRFSLTPKGEHEICVCLGTACRFSGGQRILDALERTLGVKEGETTEDMKFSVEVVRCVGACSMAPALVVDDETPRKMTPTGIGRILSQYD